LGWGGVSGRGVCWAKVVEVVVVVVVGTVEVDLREGKDDRFDMFARAGRRKGRSVEARASRRMVVRAYGTLPEVAIVTDRMSKSRE